MLAGRLRKWQDTVLLVKAGTVLRWHREAFGSSGRASRSLELGKARAAPDTIELVRLCWLLRSSTSGSLKNLTATSLELFQPMRDSHPVFVAVIARLRSVARGVLKDAATTIRDAFRPAPVAIGIVRDLCRTRKQLVAENAALRLQLIVAARKVKRPAFRTGERALLVGLASRLRSWTNTILLVKPETVLRWHRDAFRLHWMRKSRASKPREPRLAPETIELIRRMATDNGTWGAERIRGELLKLGLRVAKRTIQHHIRAVRPPGDGHRWRTFLKNHTIWACDFLQTYDIWFRPLFAFVVIDVNTKRVIHVAVTREPNERWTAQQLRQLTPFGTAPHFIIRDRDTKFGSQFDRVAKSSGIRVLKTAFRSPLMNATCERFLGSVRRECLDHVIVLSERHLRSVLLEYVAFFNSSRPHQGIEQRVPVPSTSTSCSAGGRVLALPVLGGLHHDYRCAA